MTRSEEEIGAELAHLWAAVSKMASSLMWCTGHEIDVPVPQVMEVPAMKQETVEEMEEMLEIIVVSDAVKSISPRERVQQRTPEQIEDVPQFREETIDALTLVPRERAHSKLPKNWRSTGDGMPKQAFAYSRVGLRKIALQERIFEGMRNKISRECLLHGFQVGC